MRADWFGDRAVLVSLTGDNDRQAVRAALEGAFPDCSVRAGLSAVIVETEHPDPLLLPAVASAVSGLDDGVDAPSTAGRVVTIPVQYDGEDLADVAGRLACSVADIVRAHQEQAWSVAMMGFAPGFAYLVPEGPHTLRWPDLPRRDAPRSRVPAGSVAVAAGMSAVYPSPMPGGWHLLGRSEAHLFDPRADDPALLHPGDTVRFVEAP